MLENLLKSLPPVKIIKAGKCIPIDLSATNSAIAGFGSAAEFEDHIGKYRAAHQAEAAYGGYNEERNLYKRSSIFNDPESEERNIHIGTDLWIKAGTPVLVALDGKVHSFNYNAGVGNYGPTIILEHHTNAVTFYTLYGHLAVESIESIEIGDTYKQEQELAVLGDSDVNGDYAPHLHFQVIKNIGNHFGDYPGVCSKKDRAYYLGNCPDPNLLLKLK